MLWRQAAFCGIEIVTYAMMANHFHVLARVPEPVDLSDGQLRARHFSDGVALGSRESVNAVFREFREQSGPRRRSGARPIQALAALGLNTLRDLRMRAFG